MKFLKRFCFEDKDYNHPVVRATGIIGIVLFVNHFIRIYDKYSYVKGFFISIPYVIVFLCGMGSYVRRNDKAVQAAE